MKKLALIVAALSMALLLPLTSCSSNDDNGADSEKVAVTSITVTGANSATTVAIAATLQLTATVSPDNATDKTVTWSSNDTSKATVGSTTGLVTGVAAGDVVITATANDGSNIAGTYNVTVNENGTPVDNTVYYIYKSSDASHDISNTIADWSSGSTISDDTSFTTLGTVKKIESGTGWGNASCIAFTALKAGKLSQYDYLTFKINISNMTITTPETNLDFTVKVPTVEKKYSLSSVGTAIEGLENWYKVVIPMSDFSTSSDSATELGIFQFGTGYFYVADIGVYGANGKIVKTPLKNLLSSANTLYTTAHSNEGTDAGTYSSTIVASLQSAIDAAQSVYDNSSATQDQVDSALASLQSAVDACIVNSYASPVAYTTDVTPLASLFVTDSKISTANAVTVNNYSDGWNGTFATENYTTSDNVVVKKINFSVLNGNSCGCWAITANSNIAVSDESTKDLYVHFDYIASADFTIKPICCKTTGSDVELSVDISEASADANGWKSADINITSGETSTNEKTQAMTQFGWISTTVQNVYITNVYFYEADKK